MKRSLAQRLLAPVADMRAEEVRVAWLMFAYSFLAITSYNVIKPITRSKFIQSLGADDLPLAQLAAGLLIGVIMQGYSRAVVTLPRRWVIPVTQGGIVAVLAGFWILFGTERVWVAWSFYVFGLIFGILVVSQFWTLANDIYDPRQAKRLFGFIYSGAPLGGVAAGAITGFLAQAIGTRNLLLISAATLSVCAAIVVLVVRAERPAAPAADSEVAEEQRVGGRQALQLLRESKHLQIIGLVISFAAIGAALIEQQLNMAAQEFKGRAQLDALTAFLGQVGLWMSAIAFVLQIGVTSRIHRFLGIGFALLILPVGLGTTAVVMLLNAALWAPTLARVLDQSLRYTVDKTSREVLFLPLPTELKYRAKPFVDVTVDRFAKALGALVVWLLIKPWGLNLTWQQVSFASLGITGAWVFMALRARRQYLTAFRQSLERGDIRLADERIAVADLTTIETLVEELGHTDERRVLNAIDMLEALDKRNLITPLLLHHEAAPVRARALAALGAGRPDVAERWLPAVERLMSDSSPEVRAAAVGALSSIRHARATELVRPHLDDSDPRVVSTAAAVLARSARSDDRAAAEAALVRLAADTRDSSAEGRKEVASAIVRIADPRFHHLLMPLLYDASPDVAEEALESVRRIGRAEFLFVPALVSLLRHRRLKSGARAVLTGYGEEVLDTLGHFLRDPEEDVWVRRHIPATLARLPYQKSMDILVAALGERDGFLRYKVVDAIERLHHEYPAFTFPREPIETLALKEANRYFLYLSLRHNLERWPPAAGSLLVRALDEKIERTVDRIYRLLGLTYPWKDIAAARWAIEHGDARIRASGVEYLDNTLSGALRKRLMPVLEDMPLEEKVRRGNVLIKTRPRDAEQTLLELINDEDAVVAASAISLVAESKMWVLADDLEHVLAHRVAADWFVFEAASWALAEYRMPRDRRRSLWIEPLPAVELAGRLRRLPIFASVSVDELFRLAGTGRQMRYEPGRVLLNEGAVPEGLQILIDGRISYQARTGEVSEAAAPIAVGLEEMLEGISARQTVRALDACVCLSLTSDEWQTLLADNTLLVQGLFRLIVGNRAEQAAVVRGRGNSGALRTTSPEGLTPIEKVLALKQVPLFAHVTSAELLHLATVVRETPLRPGQTLFSEADAASIYVILAGEIALDGDQAREVARAGDALCVFETMAALPAARKGTARQAGVAVRLPQEDLFDLLGQRPLLLQQIFSALFAGHQP